MTDIITLTGIIATDPRALRTQAGLAITSFRLASSQRRYDRVKGEWVDGDTNWYTVTAFRQLAENVHACTAKGQRVVVMGRVRIRPWESGERSGITVEVDADAIGHDLTWGRSTFERRAVTAGAPAGASSGSDDVDAPDGLAPSSVESPGAEDAHPTTPDDPAGRAAPSATVGADDVDSGDAHVPADGGWGTPAPRAPDEMPVPF